MIRNYLLVAFRNLLKNKSYITINTLGLGISLACCITAYLLLAYNVEFDSFHRDGKVRHLYRVHTLSHDKNGKAVIDDQAPLVLAPIASEEITGLGRYTRYLQGECAMRYGDKAFNEGIAFADSSFFDLFDFPLATGNVKSFRDKKTIFLSEKMAQKYFGDDDPTGKLMVLNFVNNYELEVLVGGVMKKIPNNSTFAFEAILRIENFLDIHKIKIDDWRDWRNPSTFFEVPTAEAAVIVSRAFGKYIPNRNKIQTDMVVESYQLVPFKSNYTWDDIHSSWTSHRIGMGMTFIFIAMAVVVLLIACFNLTNTTMAMTARRLKEVGVRKAIGAGRSQIAFQFLLETLITIVLSLGVGLLVAQVIVPAFYAMWGFPFGIGDLDGLNFFILLLMLVFLAAVVAGTYPALLSSKFKPTQLLKGSVKIGGTNLLIRTLVGAQFALSVMVLIAGISFFQNSRFQEKIEFGYDKDMVLTVRIQGESDYKTMEAAVTRNPKVLAVAVSDGNVSSNNYQVPVTVDTAQYEVQALGVGKNYFETLGLRFAEGRAFDPDNASDYLEGIVVNKEFVKRTGIRDPIDKIIILHNTRRRILGIVENHVDNLWRSANFEPFVFYPAGRDQYVMMLVKAKKEDLPEVQKFTERTWKELFPTRPFESAFQEDLALGDIKQTNGNMQKVFLFITLLGGLLSASGIFALASLNIAKRTKEIGIRKALGASVPGIIGLLNREFVIILLCAGILGAGAGYFLTGIVMDEFYAYHAPVGIGAVIFCGLTIFCFGILATGSATVRAARANPVETLRTE